MKQVLDVGNCNPDHAAITTFLKKHFKVSIDRAKLPADAMAQLRAKPYDLVLVNRKLDEDYSDGIEIIRQMKADPDLQQVPVMLITNFAEHQDAAEAVGALRGFGKLEYADPATLEKLKVVLAPGQ